MKKFMFPLMMIIVAFLNACATQGSIQNSRETSRGNHQATISRQDRDSGLSRRGQGACINRGYEMQHPEAHAQALDMDQSDRRWSEEDRRDRQMTQRERDAEVRREVALRRQAERERNGAIDRARRASREARQWSQEIRRAKLYGRLF